MGEANTGRPNLSRIDNGKDGSMDDAMIGNTGDAPGRAAYFRVFVAVFALIMTLWAVIFFDLQRIHEASFAKSRDDLLNLTQAAAQDVEASVKEIDVTLLDLRDRWLDDPARFPAVVRNRQAYLERDRAVQVAVIDANGIMAFTNLEQPDKPLDLSDREHFRVHRSRNIDELYISEPLLGRVSKRWTVQFTRPIYDRNAQFAGVLVLSVSPEYFYAFVKSSTLPERAAFNLVRSSGEFLSRYPDPKEAIGKKVTHLPFLDDLTPDVGFFSSVSQIDGVARLYAWKKLDRYSLVIVIGHAIDVILKPYYAQRRLLIVVGSGVSLLLLLIGYLNVRAIGQRRKVAAKLMANEERWRLALEAAGDGVWDWDVAAGTVVFSRGWKAMLGYAPEEIGNSLDEWKMRVHPDDMEHVMHDVTEHFEGRSDSYINEHRVLCKNGNWKWILDRGMVILRDKAGVPLRMVGTHTDISARKEMEHTLKNLATTDALTGLGNRRSFLEALETEMARVQRYPGVQACLLMVDLDHFKKINDTYGHATGDAMLKHVAGLLRGAARRSDFTGRIGGEEFAVLLTETGMDKARQYAETLCKTIRESTLEFEGKTIPVTSSIGLTQLKRDDSSVEITMHRADMALYEAKHAGRDRVVVHA
ncbi:diguanylate cyclase [Noviherbaspirillum agri]